MSRRRSARRENPAGVALLAAVSLAGAAFGVWWLAGRAGGSVDKVMEAATIATAYPKMSSYADEVVRVADGLGIKPAWLANVINFESNGGNPQARNPSGATGLIQFMDATARELGTTTAALAGMSGRDQMLFVERYFKLSRIPKPLRSQLDVMMAVYYPYAIGRGTEYVIGSERGADYVAKVQAANPGIKTAGDYYRYAMKHARLPV